MSTPAQRTDTLIRELAASGGGAPRRRRRAGGWLLAGVAVALAVAVGVVVTVFGMRDDLPGHLFTPIHAFKLVAMACAAIAGLVLVRAAGSPGMPWRVGRWLMPLGLVYAIGLWGMTDAVSWSGVRAASVPTCLAAIVLASLPGLALIIAVIRHRATPIWPARAGAAAGLLAGAIGALAYTLSCRNDGAVFVTLWYTLAILCVVLLGAAIGRRALAWT